MHGYRRTQTGTAIFSSRRNVGLSKLFEQCLDFVRGDSDPGIDHLEPQPVAGAPGIAAGAQFRPVEDAALLERARKVYDLPLRYLLYLGGFEVRKNVGIKKRYICGEGEDLAGLLIKAGADIVGAEGEPRGEHIYDLVREGDDLAQALASGAYDIHLHRHGTRRRRLRHH